MNKIFELSYWLKRTAVKFLAGSCGVVLIFDFIFWSKSPKNTLLSFKRQKGAQLLKTVIMKCTLFREFLKVPGHFRPRSTSSPKSYHASFSNQESRKKSGRHQSTSSTSQLPKRRSLPRLDRCHFAKKHFWVACLARIMRKQGTHNSPTISATSSLTASDISKCKSGLQDLLKCETCCSAFRSEFNGKTS